MPDVSDALDYLNEVKLAYTVVIDGRAQHPEFDAFLKIMKEFKNHTVNTPGVILRVSELFRGHRELILGFNTFLPAGHKIKEEDLDAEGNLIGGVAAQQERARQRPAQAAAQQQNAAAESLAEKAAKRQELGWDGALNAASPWTRATRGDYAFYERHLPHEQTLEPPMEGVRAELCELSAEQFLPVYAPLKRTQELVEVGLDALMSAETPAEAISAAYDAIAYLESDRYLASSDTGSASTALSATRA